MQFPTPLVIEETDSVVGTHSGIDPAKKRKQSRIAVVPVIAAFPYLPDKKTPPIKQVGDILLDKDVAVHQYESVRKETEKEIDGLRVLGTSPSVRRRLPVRIMRKEFLEIQQLPLRVVDDGNPVHLSERKRIRVVEHRHLAVGSMLPHAPYRGPRQFGSVEMNYADILLHRKKGRDFSRPTLILCIVNPFRLGRGDTSHRSGNGIVEVIRIAGGLGTGTGNLARELDHARGLLDVLGVALPGELDGNHVVLLGQVDEESRLIVERVVVTALVIATLTHRERLEVGEFVGAGDDGVAGDVAGGNGVGAPGDIAGVAVVQDESDGERIRLLAQQTATIALRGLDEDNTTGGASLGVGLSDSLSHLGTVAEDLQERILGVRQGKGNGTGESLMEGGRIGGVGGVADDGSGHGDGIARIVGTDLLDGDDAVQGLADEVGKGDGAGVHGEGVHLQLDVHVRRLGLLEGDDAGGTDEIGTSSLRVAVEVLEEDLASSSAFHQQFTGGIRRAGGQEIGHYIQIASLVGVEICHKTYEF